MRGGHLLLLSAGEAHRLTRALSRLVLRSEASERARRNVGAAASRVTVVNEHEKRTSEHDVRWRSFEFCARLVAAPVCTRSGYRDDFGKKISPVSSHVM
jgi:hypothetical protein